MYDLTGDIYTKCHGSKKIKYWFNLKLSFINSQEMTISKVLQSLWKTLWSFFKKLKIELLCDPEVLLQDIYTWKNKTKHEFEKIHGSLS